MSRRLTHCQAGGPRWNPVGSGREFVDVVADLDIAVPGSGPSDRVELARGSVIDKRCEVWLSLYEKAQSG